MDKRRSNIYTFADELNKVPEQNDPDYSEIFDTVKEAYVTMTIQEKKTNKQENKEDEKKKLPRQITKKQFTLVAVICLVTAFGLLIGLFAQINSDFIKALDNASQFPNALEYRLLDVISKSSEQEQDIQSLNATFREALSILEDKQRTSLEDLFKTMTNHLRKGFFKVSDDWVSFLNGFQYKLFPNKAENWTSALEFCSNVNGSLVTASAFDFRLVGFLSMKSWKPSSRIWVDASAMLVNASVPSECIYYDIDSSLIDVSDANCSITSFIMCQKPVDLLI